MSRKIDARPQLPAHVDRTDRRILRTRDTLGDALIELMHDKPFDSITVQQVLDRAGVSRSTFYTHYRDKDDLFLSDVEDFLEQIGTLLTRRSAPACRLFPVEELFTHLADLPSISEVINRSGKGPDVRELGIGCFARSIEKRLIFAGVKQSRLELNATAHSLAGSLFSLLDWWLRNDKTMAPKDLDAHFHRLAWGGLGTTPPENR
jgi:AcrR family transcriptional regulator